MLEYTFLFTLILCISLFFGIYALSLAPKNRTHQFFFVATFCVSIMCGLFILSNRFDDPDPVWLIVRLGTAVNMAFFYFLYLFIENLSGFKLPLTVKIAILLLFLLSLFVSSAMDPFLDLIKDENIWKFKGILTSPWVYFLHSYVFVNIGIVIFILIRKLLSIQSNREKRQYAVLSVTMIFSFFPEILMLLWVTSEHFQPNTLMITPMPIFFLCFLAGCLYCIVNYRLFRLTPELVSRDILSYMTDSVILLDQNLRLITANRKTISLIGEQQSEGPELKDMVREYSRVETEIEKLLRRDFNDFSCRLHFRTSRDGEVLMDVRFSIVKDKFNDVLGILLIGKEVKELNQLKRHFKITSRETEIVQFLISGMTNAEIATEMKISENTVKRHITNIYNKFGCNNRMQLLSALKSFDLMPEQESEKVVIIG